MFNGFSNFPRVLWMGRMYFYNFAPVTNLVRRTTLCSRYCCKDLTLSTGIKGTVSQDISVLISSSTYSTCLGTVLIGPYFAPTMCPSLNINYSTPSGLTRKVNVANGKAGVSQSYHLKRNPKIVRFCPDQWGGHMISFFTRVPKGKPHLHPFTGANSDY